MEQGRNEERLKQQQDQQQPPQQRRVKPSEMAETQNQNHGHQPHHQPPPAQKCPRCDSSNTKFCYYNNYSLSQPRYFCKACRRYWTQGGTLRNVPVGGGCRKSKRPKPSNPSTSATGESSRTQSFPPTMISGQVNRALTPAMMPTPSMGSSLYGGGAFLSSLAAMQSLPGGINQGPPSTASLGGAVGHFGSNMALLQGLNLPSFKAPAPENLFQAQNDSFSSHQRPPVSSWTQSFINRGGATSSSAAGPSFWSGGDNQAASSSSFNPNYWPDNQPGFDPPQ